MALDALELPFPLRMRLERWARARYPHEACGLLLGRRTELGPVVVLASEARNLEVADARRHFVLDPADHLAAEERARALDLEVIGIWHSHPDQPARPSEADRAQAWEGWSYVIVSLGAGGTHDVRAWRPRGAAFEEQDVRPACREGLGAPGAASVTDAEPPPPGAVRPRAGRG